MLNCKKEKRWNKYTLKVVLIAFFKVYIELRITLVDEKKKSTVKKKNE